MIKSVDIVGYLSHDSTHFEFGPKFNVINGDSDSGKSVLFRAVEWVLSNRPISWGFKRWGTFETKVGITFDDGKEIKRTRTAKENSYEVSCTKFDTVGKQLPDIVAKVSNMDERNISSQHSSYFMIQDSPAQRAKLFNKAAGLEIIDDLTKEVDAMINEARGEIRVRDNDRNTIVLSLDKYAYVDKLEKAISQARTLLESYQHNVLLKKEIAAVVDRVEDEKAQYNARFFYLNAAMMLCNKAEKQLKQVTEQKEMLRRVSNMLFTINKNRAEAEQFGKSQTRMPLVTKALDLCSELDVAKRKWKWVAGSMKLITGIREEMQSLSDKIQENQNRYDTLLGQYSVCPICGSLLKEDQ